MKALCIRADSDLFRLGECYHVNWIDEVMDTAHIFTGNYFGDILVCGLMYGCRLCGAKVENEENIYIFELLSEEKDENP